MRILGFSRKWEKLSQPVFTTFRLPRRDKDWSIGEVVQLVYHPRSKDREVLGRALIKNIEARSFNPAMAPKITEEEAITDGFTGMSEMRDWLGHAHQGRALLSFYKLTLEVLK